MLAVAARVGAPLGHDFCAISLSDNLKPWALIERRLAAAAEAGFVIALYNPVSKARPTQLGAAFEILGRHLPSSTPVIFGRAVGRDDERIAVVDLAQADDEPADMATLIIVGSAATRVVARPGRPPLVYTPRSAIGGPGMIDPGHGLVDRRDGSRLRQRRTPDQDHLDAERPRRGDLAVAGVAAAVPGHDGVDRMLRHERAFVVLAERSARLDIDRVLEEAVR